MSTMTMTLPASLANGSVSALPGWLATALFALSVATASADDPLSRVGAQALSALQGKTILLAGATGNNGSAILRQFQALGIPVRAMSRNAAKARKTFGSDGIEWVEANVTDPASLAAAAKDADVVIWAVATAMPFGGNRPEKVDGEGMANLAAAARSAGARRFVAITSASSGDEEHFLNWVGDMMIWKGKGEEAVMASGLEYVIVAPAGIDFDSPGGEKPIRLSPRTEYQRGQKITSADLSSAIIAAAALPDAANRIFLVYNGEGTPDDQWQTQFSAMPADDPPRPSQPE